MFDGLIKKLLGTEKGSFEEPILERGRLPRVPLTSVGGMFGDLHQKYGYSVEVPLEQAKALFADAPAEMTANFSDEQLRRMAFTAEWLARMYVVGNTTSETVEQATKRFALHGLEQSYNAAKKVGG